jgi:hypothetical protein
MQEGRTAALPCEPLGPSVGPGGDPCERLPPCLPCVWFQPQQTLGECLLAFRTWLSTCLCLSRLYERLWHMGSDTFFKGVEVVHLFIGFHFNNHAERRLSMPDGDPS